jgi:transposase
MKHYKLRKLRQRRQFVQGRYLVGIDPAKAKHQAQILDTDGLPVGSTFSFAHSFTGFHHQLWKRLAARLPELAHLPRPALAEHLVFAVEASCNLWANLVAYLRHQGYRVVLVSPLSTCHARPSKSGDFSRTDVADGSISRQGRLPHSRPGPGEPLPLS